MTGYINIIIWIVLGLVGIALLVGLLLILYNGSKVISIKRLKYQRYFSEEGVYEGEPLYLIEELANHSFLPMFHVDVESHITSKIKLDGCYGQDAVNQHFISRFTIMPFTSIKRKHHAVALKRGYYELETAKVEFAGMDLFLESKARLYVYPRELKTEEEQNVNRYLQYDARTRLPLIVDQFSFMGIRDYMRGDPFNAINFKASAKRGLFMVNDKGYLLGRQIQVYVNFQMPEKSMELTRFEQLMERALANVSYILRGAINKGYKIGFSSNSRMVNGARYLKFPMHTGKTHYKELLRELALVRVIYGNSFVSVIDMDINDCISSTDIYILSAYLDESIDNRIEILKNMGNTVSIIMLEEG